MLNIHANMLLHKVTKYLKFSVITINSCLNMVLMFFLILWGDSKTLLLSCKSLKRVATNVYNRSNMTAVLQRSKKKRRQIIHTDCFSLQ